MLKPDHRPPTQQSVQERVNEFRTIGLNDFVSRYSNGVYPRRHYIRCDDQDIPVKALWRAAHRPPHADRRDHTRVAEAGLRTLGFDDFVILEQASEPATKSQGKRNSLNGTPRELRQS